MLFRSDFAFMSIFFAKGSWKILVSFLIVFAIISFVFKKGRCIYPETRVPVFFWLYPVLTFCAFAAIKPSAFIFNFAAMLGIYLIARKIKILNRI